MAGTLTLLFVGLKGNKPAAYEYVILLRLRIKSCRSVMFTSTFFFFFFFLNFPDDVDQRSRRISPRIDGCEKIPLSIGRLSRRRDFELDIRIARHTRFRKVRGGLEVYVLGSLERQETRRHGFYRGDLGISSSRHSDLYAELAVIAAVYLVCIQKGSRHTGRGAFLS